MDRRTSIKWVMAAGAAWPWLARGAAGAAALPEAHGYGTDPALLSEYHAGALWPLTLTAAQRQLAGSLADLIIPADEHSPSATAVGVVDFIDEWVSAPYPRSRRDRPIILAGLEWLEQETARRFQRSSFAALTAAEQHRICEDICAAQRAAPERRAAAEFFALFRDLTAGGFYTTPAGRQDLRYLGNVPQAQFEGPPAELLRKLNLP